MLQDLTRSAILVAAPQRAATSRARGLDERLAERSPAFLAELADLAYQAGDRRSAEYFIRCLYAAHDRRAKRAAATAAAAGSGRA